MSRKNRKPKPTKPALLPTAYAWLAEHCSETQWNRILDLREISLEAVLAYLKNCTDKETFARFEEANLPPEVLAERRAAEAKRLEAEENERRKIRTDGIPPPTDAQIVAGKPLWHPLAHQTPEEKITAAKEAREKETGFVEMPEAIF